jgi:hypothetical protein
MPNTAKVTSQLFALQGYTSGIAKVCLRALPNLSTTGLDNAKRLFVFGWQY